MRKYGKKNCVVDKEVVKLMGNPKILLDEELKPEEMRKPVVVLGEGEKIELNVDEVEVLSLGPKFCQYNNLVDEEFETDLEECLMKVKWDFMGDDKGPKSGLEDVALRVLLGDDVCTQIEDENEEEQELIEAETRNIFDHSSKTFNFSKRRATDMKCNSRVYFPRKARSLEEESKLETLRVELHGVFKDYVRRNCKDGGKQVSNLTVNQLRGLKSIRKRVTDGELVILPTDKSGRLAVMTRESYRVAGMLHTKKDREVGWGEIKESQKELNGHVSMVLKTFKVGYNWGHSMRIRETTMGEGLSICPMSLLFKDHKGWSSDSGTAPPTRPVVGGHLGVNMHLSELVSDILDPVVSNYEGGREIISTEDMLARSERMNTENEGWSERSYWGDLETDEYKACTTCRGEEGYTWDEGMPEVCTCAEMDGISEDGKVMITMGAMKGLRRKLWEDRVGWDESNLDMEYTGVQVLHEDLQDQTNPMVLIGTDVESLYPSLDISQVVEDVGRAILESTIVWQDIDYLEASRYVALNWTEDRCRQSELWRVLPKRRKNQGTRPGLKGAGPQGGVRGDQEQWVFPRVRLRPKEKKLLVATVVKLATKAMFTHHYYSFGGLKFQQREGGPIGLRGTCSIARLIMQMFDKKWEDLVRGAGLRLQLYMRYMDDGRLYLHPLKRGWRWRMGQLVFKKRWEIEDGHKSLLEVTVDAIKGSMTGVTNYLRFTYETGSEYSDGWLPTLDTSLLVTPENVVVYKYYEKPTTANTTILKSTAMAENPKVQCLSNDLVRRLLNTREGLPLKYRAEVVNSYGVKLLTSGYGYDQVRRILINGAKGYLAKVKRRTTNGGHLHRTAAESHHVRVKKKLLSKSTWYKDKRRVENNDNSDGLRRVPGSTGGAVDSTMKTRAVLFVEQSPMGALASKIREQLQHMGPTLGFKIRVVERTGRNIQTNFSQLHTWRGMQCGREECVTCNQDVEELPDCTRASIVYESICTRCNPGAKKKGELEAAAKGPPSLYVGESSRSIQERALEHWGAARRRAENSHMEKHQSMEHKGEPPDFIFKVISNHRTALNRQVREAVRIRRRGGAGQILNSKAEYNRCHIPRLTIEKEDEDDRKLRLEKEKAEKDEITMTLKDMDSTWELRKDQERERAEKKRSRQEDQEQEDVVKKRTKRMKYTPLEKDWGEDGGSEGEEEDGASNIVHASAPPRPSSKGTIMTTITDFFPILGTSKRMDKSVATKDADLWMDPEDGLDWFEDQTAVMADLYNPGVMKSNEDQAVRVTRDDQVDGMKDVQYVVDSKGKAAQSEYYRHQNNGKKFSHHCKFRRKIICIIIY